MKKKLPLFLLLVVMVLGSFVSLGIPSVAATTGVSQNVQYSVDTGVSLPVNVSCLYANGTYDAAFNSPSWGSWAHGGALNYSNGAYYVQTANIAPDPFANGVTVSGWFNSTVSYTPSGSSIMPLVCYGAGNIPSGFYLGYVQYGYGWTFSINNQSHMIGSSTNMDANSLYYVVGVYNNSGLTIYVNGTCIASTAASGTITSLPTPLYMPQQYCAYLGMIANVMVCSTPWNQSQVTYYYNNPENFTQAPPGLVAWYNFNESSGSYVYGYDAYANFTAQNSPQSLTISHQLGEVNSTLYWNSPSLPYTNATYYQWALASGNSTSWRVNDSSAQTLYLTGDQTEYYLTVGATNHGSMNVSSGWYTNGTIVPILDTANLNYLFSNFTLDGTNSTGNPITVTMMANHTLTSDNTLVQHYLTVNSPTGGAINQTSAWFTNGTTVDLLATPSTAFYFLNWAIDGVNSTANPTSVLMTANHAISAYFQNYTYYPVTITCTITPTVLNQYQNITWTSLLTFVNGTPIVGREVDFIDSSTLVDSEYTNSSGYATGTYNCSDTPGHLVFYTVFNGETNNTGQFVLDIAISFTTSATTGTAQLLTISDTGGGTENASTGTLPYGTVISVAGTALAGYNLTAINADGVNGSTFPVTVTMTGPHTLIFYYASSAVNYYLTVTDNGHGSENVSSGWYTNGTTVTIMCTGSEGYVLLRYVLDGVVGADNPSTILMTANHTIAYEYILGPGSLYTNPNINNGSAVTPHNNTVIVSQTNGTLTPAQRIQNAFSSLTPPEKVITAAGISIIVLMFFVIIARAFGRESKPSSSYKSKSSHSKTYKPSKGKSRR